MTNRAMALNACFPLLASAALIAAGQAPAPSPGPAAPSAPPTPSPPPQSNRAGDRFENVQVLGDISPAAFYATMHLVRASLGTTCDHCHDPQHYEADTKPAKVTARRHMRMVLDVNKNVFEGRTVVTCNSCHRGSLLPVAVPTVEQGVKAASTAAAHAAAQAQTD